MTTYNISDGSISGLTAWVSDVQSVTRTLTIAQGNDQLHASVDTWVPGDASKAISVGGAGLGGYALATTIQSVLGQQDVVLANSAGTTLNASSQIVTWGTDNHDSYFQVRTWSAGVTQPPYIDIVISAGEYKCAPAFPSFIDDGFGSARGISYATISPVGGSVTLYPTRVGTMGQVFDTQNHALLKTVSAGATVVELIEPSSISRFAVDGYVLITGIDTQGFGAPSNPYFFEYAQVQSIDSPYVTLTAPLKNTYKDTWPNYNVGSDQNQEPYEGGPATMYALDSTWACDITWNDITINTDYQTYGCGQRLVFNNCTMLLQGFVPSVSDTVIFNGGTNGLIQTEYDKCISNFRATGTSFDQLEIQSASFDKITVVDCTVTGSFNGTPKNLTMIGGSVGDGFIVGPLAYGFAQSLSVSGASITGTLRNVNKAGNVSEYTYMGDGILRLPLSANVRPLTIPGAWAYFGSQGNIFLPCFKIIDITCDATYQYLHTTLTGPSLPTFNLDVTTNPTTFDILNCLRTTFRNNTCTDLDVKAQNNAPAGRPLWEYNERLWDRMPWNHGSGVPIFVSGKFKRIVVDVQKIYEGAQQNAFFRLDPFDDIRWIDLDGGSPYQNTHLNTPLIDITKIGVRTFTPTENFSTAVGANDSLLSPLGNVFIWGGISPGVNVNTTGDANEEQPIIFFSIEVDTGFVDDALTRKQYIPTHI